MKIAIFGAGLMGATIARDLVKSNKVDEVTVHDVERRRLRALRGRERSSKLAIRVHDVRDTRKTAQLLKRFDVGIGALPHGMSEYAIRSTIDARVNFVDLIYGWRFGQASINSECRRRGITIIPACGLAPGLTNLLAMKGSEEMSNVDEVHIMVGGVPEKRKPPLNYRIVFSFQAVLEEYLRKARIIKNRKVVDVAALSGLETITFPPPIGKCECFYTDGLSTLVQTIRGVREMDEKTIRWPGHAAQIKTLIECGLLDTRPVTCNRAVITPREFLSNVLSEKLALRKEKDLTLLRVEVSGKKDGKTTRHRFQMVDHYDSRHGITSMARTTAYPCSIAAQILASGRIQRKGLVPPEIAFKADLRDELLDYVEERGMIIEPKSI